MLSSEGYSLHTQAEHAREHEHDFWKAVNLAQTAINTYLIDGDYLGASEALLSLALTYLQLFREHHDQPYLILAESSTRAGIKIAESLSDTSGLALAYRGLAKIFEEQSKWEEVVANYQKAIFAFTENPPADNNRPAVLADMKAHLARAEYMSGDKNALEHINQAISELQQADEPPYNRDVWLSGAYMMAAQMLQLDNRELAIQYFHKAQAVIEANPELVLRRIQLQQLRENLFG